MGFVLNNFQRAFNKACCVEFVSGRSSAVEEKAAGHFDKATPAPSQPHLWPHLGKM